MASLLWAWHCLCGSQRRVQKKISRICIYLQQFLVLDGLVGQSVLPPPGVPKPAIRATSARLHRALPLGHVGALI
jgi:hypothetical protein